MEIKRILLIEDCDWHATKTKSLLSELSDMYHVECKVFAFLPQKGHLFISDSRGHRTTILHYSIWDWKTLSPGPRG